MNQNNKPIPNRPSDGRSQSPKPDGSAKPATPTYQTPTPKFTPPPTKK